MGSKRIAENIGRGLWVNDGKFTYIAIATPGGEDPYQIRDPGGEMIIHVPNIGILEVLMRTFGPNISKWRLCSKETEPQKDETDHADQRLVGQENTGAGLPFSGSRSAG